MYRTVMESSPESTYWSSSGASQYSASDETPSPLGLRSNSLARRPFEFLEILPENCPNHENCQGEIEVWKNLKKNEIFFQCSGGCKECRFLTKIATYSTCCVCGFGIVSVSTTLPTSLLASANFSFIGEFDNSARNIGSLGPPSLQERPAKRRQCHFVSHLPKGDFGGRGDEEA